MQTIRVNRRKFLGAAGAAAAGILAACAPAVPAPAPTSPPAAPAGATLLVFGGESEITARDIQGYSEKYPAFSIDRQDPDPEKMSALLAAGTPPDVIRTDGAELQNLLLRGIPLDITDFLQASPLLKVADFAPSCAYYHVGGKWYGIPKDWSPDFSFFANTQLLQEAGLTPPPQDQSIRYAELFELGRKLTRKEGERTILAGYGYELAFFARQLMAILLEQEQSLYSEDFSQIRLRDNSLALDVLRAFSELAQQGIIWSPLNPSPAGAAQDYINGTVGLIGYGYWYSAMLNNPASPDAKVNGSTSLFLPAPSWGGKKTVNPTIGGSGYIGVRQSKNPAASWTFLEWYLGGQPAKDRAASGWGVPALQSLYPLMPQTNDFQKQVQRVLQYTFQSGDANYALQFNPYYTDQVFNNSWYQNLEAVLKGTAPFEQAVEAVEREVNAAIAAGKNEA